MRGGRLSVLVVVAGLMLPAAAQSPTLKQLTRKPPPSHGQPDVSGGVARAVREAASSFPMEWFLGDYARCRSQLESNHVTVYRGEDELAVLFTSNGRCEARVETSLGQPVLALVRGTSFRVSWIRDEAALEQHLKRFNANAGRPDAGASRCASDAECSGGKCVRVSAGGEVYDLCVPQPK